eukprot:SAG11_NODE_34028_length_274_cov_0.594286_1_plen_81_part_10
MLAYWHISVNSYATAIDTRDRRWRNRCEPAAWEYVVPALGALTRGHALELCVVLVGYEVPQRLHKTDRRFEVQSTGSGGGD